MKPLGVVLQALLMVVLLSGCGAEKFLSRGDKLQAIGACYDAATQY